MAEFKGVLSRVSEDGIAYLVDQESARTFPFTFDKISGYRGEPARKLGLLPEPLSGMAWMLTGTLKRSRSCRNPRKRGLSFATALDDNGAPPFCGGFIAPLAFEKTPVFCPRQYSTLSKFGLV